MAMFDTQLLTRWETAFTSLMERLAFAFARREPRERAGRYLLGLLGWQLAEMMHEPSPQRMQRLLHAPQWDANVVRDRLRAYVRKQLAQPDGVFVLDETGLLKKGMQSAGVARHYSGTTGQIENQQTGVFLAYSSPRGTAFVDRALYLPEAWIQDRTRCCAPGMPDEVSFAPTTHVTQQMLERVYTDHVSARWVARLVLPSTLRMVAHTSVVAVRATLGAIETDLVAVRVPELRR